MEAKSKKNAIILCSGGLDSVTLSYYVKRKLGYKNITILFFDYGQRNLKAERRASQICSKGIHSDFLEIPLPELGKLSGSLINSNKKHKRLSKKSLRNTKKESQKYYVPNRNTIFLNYATALAESLFIKEKTRSDIFIGFKNEGKEHYSDTTPFYVKQFNRLNLASTLSKTRVFVPLIKKDKEDIILLAKNLSVPLKKTFSCYISNSSSLLHCGTCLACQLRKSGFHWANLKDPTSYKAPR